MSEETADPDWETPLPLTVTPTGITTALFGSAEEVHTAWQSCVDPELVVAETLTHDGHSRNYCRLVEQEYEEDGSDGVWHDWAVEVRIGEVHVTGHWRMQADGRGSDWEWCTREAQKAFTGACVLLGRRVLPAIVVEEPILEGPPPTRH